MTLHDHNTNDHTHVYDEDETDDYGYNRNASYATHSTPHQRHHAAAKTSNVGGAEPEKIKRSNTTRRVLLAVAVFVVLAVAGVLAWYFAVYKKNHDNDRGDGLTGGKGGGSKGEPNSDVGDGTAGQGASIVSPNGTVISNDPHKLKRVFYGMAYVPLNAQLPNCYNTQQSVDNELLLLVQATKRVRLYGTDCNALRYTIDAIQRLNLDLQVVVGIWIDKDTATFTRQTEEFYAVVAKYGWANIIGVSVGNEVMFDQVEPLPNLIAQITAVKNKVVQLGYPEIPVFTSDLEGANRPPLTNQEDLAGVNLHPFFSGVPVDTAASWFWTYLNNTVTPAVQQGNEKAIPLWITEVGWPTFPATGNTSTIDASIPSIPNLQKFVDTWLCDANAKNLPYYFFEFFDAPWKIWPGSAVEGFWGLLTIDKRLKVELPDCLAN
ncbi:glycoside hydrolase superfamily [Linnemannia elongata]|nr:glycoside hydrolase superfamily [Linnemannia elongata]